MASKKFRNIILTKDPLVASIIPAEPETIRMGMRVGMMKYTDPEYYDAYVENPIRDTTAILSHETLHGVLENMRLGKAGWQASDAMDKKFAEKARKLPYYGIAIHKAHKFIEERPE